MTSIFYRYNQELNLDLEPHSPRRFQSCKKNFGPLNYMSSFLCGQSLLSLMENQLDFPLRLCNTNDQLLKNLLFCTRFGINALNFLALRRISPKTA